MTEIEQRVQLLKALADTSRLTLVQALHEPQCVEELAQRCNLAPSTVSFHLGKLEKAGLVTKHKEQYYAVYTLNQAFFGRTLRELTSFHNAEEELQEERIRRYKAKVLHAFIKDGRVIRIPAQYKKRLIIIEEILRRFDPKRTYSEKEVDSVISEMCDDYVTMRRAFIDEGMMKRHDGVYEIVAQPAPQSPANNLPAPTRNSNVITRQELKREYKERRKPAGVFMIRNTANGKVYLGSSLNLEGPLNAHRFMLSTGAHRNAQLQHDWNTFGPDNFVFEIAEEVKVKDDPHFNLEDELTLLEQIWIEKIDPFGPKGYNTEKRIRQA